MGWKAGRRGAGKTAPDVRAARSEAARCRREGILCKARSSSHHMAGTGRVEREISMIETWGRTKKWERARKIEERENEKREKMERSGRGYKSRANEAEAVNR